MALLKEIGDSRNKTMAQAVVVLDMELWVKDWWIFEAARLGSQKNYMLNPFAGNDYVIVFHRRFKA